VLEKGRCWLISPLAVGSTAAGKVPVKRRRRPWSAKHTVTTRVMVDVATSGGFRSVTPATRANRYPSAGKLLTWQTVGTIGP
jgi:hypothetical protein